MTSKWVQKWVTPSVILTFILILLPQSALARESDRNRTLLSATSPFEDLVEYALTQDSGGISQALKSAEEKISQFKTLLSQAAIQQLEARIAAIKNAMETSDFPSVALNALESYRIIIEGLDPTSLQVPLEVSLLDYGGFKTLVLSQAAIPDWSSINTTIDGSMKNWESIVSKVRDPGLRDVFTTTIRGLKKSVKVKNLQLATFAARIQLDLVDFLEGYFRK